jgi:transketolase
VKIPGSYVGLPTGRAGVSHNCIEDIAVMRALPNIRIADPGDNEDLRAIMRVAVETEGPVYFRVSNYKHPDIFNPGHTFEWGKGILLRKGSDVTLFGTGLMTGRCIEASALLGKEGIDAEVIHLASIKPIDHELIIESIIRTGAAVTAENASIVGGFGSAVAEVLGETHPAPIRRIGVRDLWVESGGEDELFARHGMEPKDIVTAAHEAILMKRKVSGV